MKVALEACTTIYSRPGNFKLMGLTIFSFRSLPIWNSTFAMMAAAFTVDFIYDLFYELVSMAKTT
jgi:hypothetical protein